jgi:hypothetical protein
MVHPVREAVDLSPGLPDAAAWAHQTFRASALGDVRRTRRLIQIAAAMATMPSASLPTIFPDFHQLKGCYRFLANPAVDASGILSGVYADTVQRARDYPRLLLLADTSEVDVSSRADVRGVGHIGDGRGRGLLVHTTLVVDPAQAEVLGAIDQHVWIRRGRKGSSKDKSYLRRKRSRESARWSSAAARSARRLRSEHADVHLILVFDREGDIYEVYADAVARGTSFVVRVAQNRALVHDDEDASEAQAHLLSAAAQAPVVATKTVDVPATPGRAARNARLQIRATPVTLRPPKPLQATHDPVAVNVVWVTEEGAPRGQEPLTWCLLTREPIATAAEVLDVVGMYEARWLIEEFHMGLKTGCGIEARQVETGHALRNLLAIATPIATQLLRLRHLARRSQTTPATTVLSSRQVAVRRALRPKLSRTPTAYEALRYIANLGGFLMRSRDGEPGWRTLWKGFQMLLLAEIGYAARSG